ncbi:MAG TPA: hypothetical protein VNK67_08400 [Burkholderiales bacterium]|nr:hypothetical protein [Burkholderiales bacterium]
MSQNINLLDPAFRKKRVVLSFAALAKCCGALVLALAAIYFYQRQEVSGLAEELRSAEKLQRAQRGYVERLKGQATARKPDALLEAEIVRLETELKQARAAMEALKVGGFGNQQGFSEYLRAFSRQSLNGLWLTAFTITGGGELEIRGRVMSPDLVPSYIQRLNKEQVLAGRSFARLEMREPRMEPEAGKGAGAKESARAPRFLEFSLATTEAAAAEKVQ